MSIGTTIKKLRRERDMTQEQLSEYLGISIGAVSQWECDRTAPDISQLPLLANIFDVSSDTILGIDSSKNHEMIKMKIDEADGFYAVGDFSRSADILSDTLLKYPKSYLVMIKLADSLVLKGNNARAVTLCEKIISECTDSEIRDEAIRTISSAYRISGNTAKAIEYANMMSHAWFSREDMLMFLLEGKEAFENLRDYADFCIGRIFIILDKLSYFSEIYDNKDKIKLYKQLIVISKTIFCDNDYHYSSEFVANAYSRLAEIYMAVGDKNNAIDCLKCEADFRIMFDSYDAKAEHTSPAVRGYCDGGWIPDSDGNSSMQMLKRFSASEYDFLRNEVDFTEIQNKLKSKE